MSHRGANLLCLLVFCGMDAVLSHSTALFFYRRTIKKLVTSYTRNATLINTTGQPTSYAVGNRQVREQP